MAVVVLRSDKQSFMGLSSDAKPAARAGARFWESDTDLVYRCDGNGNWIARNRIGEVGGRTVLVGAEFIRPNDATPYGIGDVVSNSTAATTPLEIPLFARALGGSGYITGARLSTDKKSITPRFRVHLFNAVDPTLAVDNALHKEVYAEEAKRLGYFDLPPMATAGDAANSTLSRSIDLAMRVPFKCAAGSRSLFCVLETLDIFTPANLEKFTLSLYGELN
jgi:hypothetical protein